MTPLAIWAVILVMGAGTYLMRWSFLGLVGNRRLPAWLLRHLRYAPHAVLPAMIVPMLVPASGAPPQPLQLVIAGLALLAGMLRRSTIVGLGVGCVLWFGARALGL